jgi:hypothetical protein
MGLDIFFYPGHISQDNEEEIYQNQIEYYESFDDECNGEKIKVHLVPNGKLRVIDHFPHLNIRRMHTFTKGEFIDYLISHTFKLIREMNVYEYPTNFKKYWTDTRQEDEINLRTDLLILIDFIEGLRSSDIPDDYRVWMDY